MKIKDPGHNNAKALNKWTPKLHKEEEKTGRIYYRILALKACSHSLPTFTVLTKNHLLSVSNWKKNDIFASLMRILRNGNIIMTLRDRFIFFCIKLIKLKSDGVNFTIVMV